MHRHSFSAGSPSGPTPRPTRWALLLVACLLALGAAAVPAGAQEPLAPSLTVDTAFAPPGGIAKDDFRTGTVSDTAAAAAVHGSRIYTIGETSAGGNRDIALVARRVDGAYDTGFSDDGRLALPIGNGTDTAQGVVVLPDGRLRIVGASDVDPSSTVTNLDVAVIGLLPNGALDADFGGGDGIVLFPAGTRDDTGHRIAVDGMGRLAIAGRASTGTRDDTFVALLNPDGSPAAFGTNGVRVFDRSGPTLNDRGLDVAFRPGGGLVVLVQVETPADPNGNDWTLVLRGLVDSGPGAGGDDAAFSDDGDLVLPAATPDPGFGGVLVHDGRLWVAGSTRPAVDQDAFLARLDPNGGGLALRQFDMRGRSVDSSQAVTSQAVDLVGLPGPVSTLVVVGSVITAAGTDWAAAAFNRLDGDLAAAGFGDVVLAANGQTSLVGVDAADDGWVGVAGALHDSSTFDSSLGTARLLVDAEKECDLAVDVVEPLEIVFENGRPARLTPRVRNAGTKACPGGLAAPAPYELGFDGARGTLDTGVLMPGGSRAFEGATLHYSGPRRREDVLQLRVQAAGDANPNNDVGRVRVVFSFCDLDLDRAGSPRYAPTEGSRRFEFSVRNVGTAACEDTRVSAVSGARTTSRPDPFDLGPARSASDEIAAAVSGRRRPGRRVLLEFRAIAEDDVNPANDTVTLSPVLLGVGDTTARRPSGRVRRLSGSARPGRGPARARSRRVTRVDVAVRRLGARCRWLASRSARFRSGRSAAARARCNRPIWLRARGTRRWKLALRRALPPGRYVVMSRATIGAGFREASFSARDRNRVSFRAR